MSNEESKLKLWYAIAAPQEDRTERNRISSALFSHFLNLEILLFFTPLLLVLKVILHRIPNGFITLQAFLIHPH
jgi:hypothetical protein